MLQLNNVKSGYSTGVINSNFQAIEDYINNYVLNRDGVVPGEANQMNVHLDMNSKNILNVKRMDAKEIGLNGMPIKELLDNTVEEATQEANRAEQEADRAKQEADRAERAVEYLDGPFSFLGDYGPGLVATSYNQVVRDSNGEFWRVSGKVDLPYITTGTGLPEGDAFVPAGDVVLRQDLASPFGAAMVGNAVMYVDSIPDLLALNTATLEDGRVVITRGAATPTDGFGAEYVFVSDSTAAPNNSTVLSPYRSATTPGRWVRSNPLPALKPGRSLDGTDVYLSVNITIGLGYEHGYWWGRAGNSIVRSRDGENWEVYCDQPLGPISGIVFTEDDEVLIAGGRRIFKSTGFHDAPSTVTWKEVFNWDEVPGAVGAIQPWGFKGHGRKAIANHYSSSWFGQGWNRVGVITLDNGDTWQVAYDGQAIHGTESEGHPHGVEYDRWADTFYFIEGHSASVGVYYSYDDGQSWTRIASDIQLDNGPTSITATDRALVLGSDTSGSRGIYTIKRPSDRTDVASMRLEFAYELRDPDLIAGIEGIYGFGSHDLRDPRTGIVYTGWADSTSNRPCITASDGERHGLVYISYDEPAGTNSRAIPLCITADNEIVIRIVDGSGNGVRIVKTRLVYGEQFNDRGLDAGRVWGGNARFLGSNNNNNSVAVGPESLASSRMTTAVGQGATAGTGSIAQSGQVALGYGAHASGNCSLAAGLNATALGANGTVVGGRASGSNDLDVTVVGHDAMGQGFKATAIGAGATASSSGAVAIGSGATATHGNSVALGRDTSSTGSNQVAIGARSISMETIAGVAAPASGGLLFFYDNGGTVELRARFANGKVVVIATDAS